MVGFSSAFPLLEGQGARARVIRVLRDCIWNAPSVLNVLPAFDYTGSLGSPHVEWSIPLVKLFHPG